MMFCEACEQLSLKVPRKPHQLPAGVLAVFASQFVCFLLLEGVYNLVIVLTNLI